MRLNPVRTVDLTVSGLDEVLFPLCGKDDVLCTRLARHARLREYHRSLGCRHAERACTDGLDDPRDMYTLLNSEPSAQWLSDAVARGAGVLPWAITRESAALLTRCHCNDYPPVEVVARVNSKIWSTRVRRQIDSDDASEIVASLAQLLELGTDYLRRHGAIVIKEPHGVSGGGTVRVGH